MGAEAEVPDSLAAVLLASEEVGIRTSGSTKRELVEGDALSAGGDDSTEHQQAITSCD